MKSVDRAYFYFRNFFARYFPALYAFCESRKKFCKYIFSGTLTGGSDLFLLFLFHGVFAWGIILSTSTAFIMSFALSFILQKIWTFRNQDKNKLFHQLGIYFFNAFLNLNINALLMHLLVSRFGIWYLFAQLAVNATIGSLNFLVYKFIIFKKDKEYENRIEPGQSGK